MDGGGKMHMIRIGFVTDFLGVKVDAKKKRFFTSTAAHAGGHTQNVYGSWDDSVSITFAECEKIELMNK